MWAIFSKNCGCVALSGVSLRNQHKNLSFFFFFFDKVRGFPDPGWLLKCCLLPGHTGLKHLKRKHWPQQLRGRINKRLEIEEVEKRDTWGNRDVKSSHIHQGVKKVNSILRAGCKHRKGL